MIRITRRNWTPTTAGSTKWRQFGTIQFMRESQNWAIYQAFTIWFHGRDIQRKRIPGSQPQRSSTLESLSARFTKTILTSQQQLLLLSTPCH